MNFIFFGFMLCLFCNIVFCCVLLLRIILTLYSHSLYLPRRLSCIFSTIFPRPRRFFHISSTAYSGVISHTPFYPSLFYPTMFYSSLCGPIAPRRKDSERRAHSQIPKTMFSYLSLFLVSVFDFILDRMASAEPNMKIFVSALGFHYL